MNLPNLDIINPLDGLVGRTIHGPMHRFTFDGRGQYSGRDVEMLLRQYGIHIWGREVGDDGERAFLVKRTQAVWAEYLLCRAHVPLTCPLLDARNQEYVNRFEDGSLPTPWSEQGVKARSFVDRMVDLLDRLGG